MADTTFNSGTVVAASWLNDINNHVYNGKSLDNISVINVKDSTFCFLVYIYSKICA